MSIQANNINMAANETDILYLGKTKTKTRPCFLNELMCSTVHRGFTLQAHLQWGLNTQANKLSRFWHLHRDRGCLYYSHKARRRRSKLRDRDSMRQTNIMLQKEDYFRHHVLKLTGSRLNCLRWSPYRLRNSLKVHIFWVSSFSRASVSAFSE